MAVTSGFAFIATENAIGPDLLARMACRNYVVKEHNSFLFGKFKKACADIKTR